MKITKLILALSASVFCINAMGANMCIKDDAVMVILDPVVAGSSLSSNATGKTWSTSFNYGVISGIGGCGAAPSPVSAGTPAPDQSVLSPTSTGTYCYCKMLRPIPSQWVYVGYRSNSDANCASNCASLCASRVGSMDAVRQGMFSSVGI